MARKSQGKTSVQVVLPTTDKDKLQELADKKEIGISDIIRDALKEYFKESDLELDLNIQHGGYRGRKAKAS